MYGPPTLSTGTFFIMNKDTSRYIAADSTTRCHSQVITTAVAPDDTNVDSYRFRVKNSGESYTFVNVGNGLSIDRNIDHGTGKPILVWKKQEHAWSVRWAGPDIWIITDIGPFHIDPNAYWCDDGASDHTIKLITGRSEEGARLEWTLITA
jgi:hypothetical protein